MAVLVTSFGASWQIVPELYGFTNPSHLPLYAQSRDADDVESMRRRHAVPEVDEIWLVTTEGTEAQVRLVQRWRRKWKDALRLRIWWPEGVRDLRSEYEVRLMSELIFRVVAKACRHASGDVLLSLAGGRKTMSADVQRAGQAFGYRGMLHVIDRMDPEKRTFLGRHREDVSLFQCPLPEPLRNCFLPVVVAGGMPGSDAVSSECGSAVDDAVRSLPEEGGSVPLSSASLLDRIERTLREADGLRANFAMNLAQMEKLGNFRALYTLPQKLVRSLRETSIGVDAERMEREITWLRRLPKAELHCHLGGVLSPAQMIEVAAVEEEGVDTAERRDAGLARDMKKLRRWIRDEDLDAVRRWLGSCSSGMPDFKGLHRRWPGLRPPLGVCAFLLAFAGRAELLDELIYGALRDPAVFCGVGIERYERLGDLQGSGLLQSEAVLRHVMHRVVRMCREEKIRYLELRCSPANYVNGDMRTARKVLEVLVEEAESARDVVDIRFIFIVSRHGRTRKAEEHINLVHSVSRDDMRLRERFAGFDLAGEERAASASSFRSLFRPLHEEIVRITIHAGEGESVENIWEAVYDLSADRVGHGLTLGDRPELLRRFRDRRIALEMCPSSNFQIAGFADRSLGVTGNRYPLEEYLEKGLRATVNTDDPGISRTNLSQEYHKAAVMSEGGLTRWQVLQLVRNGFRAAFCDHVVRRRHLLHAEQHIVRDLLKGEV